MSKRFIIITTGVLVAAAHLDPDTRLEVGVDIDADTADTLVRHKRADEADPADDVPDTVEDDLHPLTIAQLRAVAEREEVDLGTASRRADLLAVIRQVRAGRAA